LTDFLDGFLAKRYNMNTVLGTYLDPLADKILINVLSISLWYSDILPTPLIVLWFGRDVALMGATYLLVKSETKSDGRFVVDPVNTPLKVEPTNISKINTVFQFLTLGVGMLQPVCGVPPGVLETLCWITGGTTIASAYSYVGGKSLTASGNKIRDTVQKEAMALRDRARRKRQK
jgi:cardiolipin synthase